MVMIEEGLPQSDADGNQRGSRQSCAQMVLLGTAIVCFGLLVWATQQTYRDAPKQPDRSVAEDGALLMSGSDVSDGKAGFQKADLMDLWEPLRDGVLFRPYTAENLVALATTTEQNLAQVTHGRPFASLDAEQQAAIKSHMQKELHGMDLTQHTVTVPDALARGFNGSSRRHLDEAAAGQFRRRV